MTAIRRTMYIGLPLAAVGGYYLSVSGGDTKVAQKKAERLSTTTIRIVSDANGIKDDVESAKASMRGQNISGAEAKKQGEEWAQIAGSKIDSTVRFLSNMILIPFRSGHANQIFAYRSVMPATSCTKPTRL